MNFHPFRAANGDLITNTAGPAPAPKPPKTAGPEVFDLSTFAGRALSAVRKRQRVGQFDGVDQIVYDLAVEVDELRETVAKLRAQVGA